MRLINKAFLLMGFLASTLAPSLIAQTASDDWKLVWQDEFDQPTLDYSKWEIEVNAFGGGNQELQIYTDRKDNVRVENGQLVLEARKDKAAIQGTEREFSSGRVRSKHRGDWLYGKFEIRAKLPRGQGVWPALWMLPTDDEHGPWASSGEIDIMELKGQEPNRVYGTLHYGAPWPNNKFSGEQHVLAEGDFAADFHLFAIEWEPKEIRWYVDGKLYQKQSKWSSTGGEYPAPFDRRFHLVFNVAVGGGFVGNPDASSVFPQSMEIDYVKVYQKP